MPYKSANRHLEQNEIKPALREIHHKILKNAENRGSLVWYTVSKWNRSAGRTQILTIYFPRRREKMDYKVHRFQTTKQRRF